MSPQKLKIAISIWSFTPNTGGLQAHAQSLCKHLMSRGHEVVVVTRSATKIPSGADYLFFNEPEEGIQIDGIPVRFLRVHSCWRPLLWIILKLHARPAFSSLAAWLFQRVAAKPAKEVFAGFDIIHHVGHATALEGFAAASAAKTNRIPFLVQPTAHPFNFGDTKLDFTLYRKADRLLVHTNYERDYFLGKGIRTPIDVVYNGIEKRRDGIGDRFRQKYRIKGPIILYIGRKAVDKGYSLVVEAFRMLQPRYPDTTLVCMGPSSQEYQVQEGPGILDLKFVGEDEKHDALAACTMLCVPSEGESFGLVFMEAGLYRKPVIARNLPVLKELLGDQAALLLGGANDPINSAVLTPEQLAGGIEAVIKSGNQYQSLGDSLHDIARKFIWTNVVCNFEKSYYQAITPKKP